MRIFLRRGMVKRYFPCLPRCISSLLVFVFLFASIGSIGASVVLWSSVAEAQGSEKAILHRNHPLVQEAIGVQHRHLNRLMGIRGVVGTGVGIGSDGLPVIKVFTARHGVKGIPEWLESTPVHVEVTGMVVALGDTTSRQRPAPIGVSTGHPAITAGTIGARVKDQYGNVYALSNNHIYANSNNASLGDSALQPGPYDGADDTEFYQIGTLYDFEPIIFGGENTMDAAIALSSVQDLDNSTLPDGYGVPNSTIFGDSNGDGFFDDKYDLLGLPVKKYGRTTGLTHGQVSEIAVTVNVCYEPLWLFCLKSATFGDQIAISPGTFSDGGDSGSLIVTEVGNNPVGLLFAGSSTRTYANRIDLVLNRFGVTIDEGAVTQPMIDVAITGIDVPTPVVKGQPEPAAVTVTVRNGGTQATESLDVTLWDVTEGVNLGTKPAPGLEPGTSAPFVFSWTPAIGGSHTLVASLPENFVDEVEANNSISTTVEVTDQLTPRSVHIADLDGSSKNVKILGIRMWKATIKITVKNNMEDPVVGATVKGVFNDNPDPETGTFECKTRSNGTCSLSGYQKMLDCLTFTVYDISHDLLYEPSDNNDPEGDSDGTNITVCRP